MKNCTHPNTFKARSAFFLVILTLCSFSFAGAQGNLDSQEVWVSIGDDLFRELTASVVNRALPPKAFASKSGVVVTRLPERALHALSVLSHEKLNRCSGFIVHDSFIEAQTAMESATRLELKAPSSNIFNIDQQTLVNGLLPQLDKANILSSIDHLSNNYTNRYYNYASGQQSAQWIHDLWTGYAAGRSDVTVTTYAHTGYVQPSVIMTIDGTSLASEVIVLGGHLDSIKSGGMTTGTVAPGADDNASGIATLSEVIRVLMANGFTPERTVKFMGYAAEEVGLLGSGDIAADHKSAAADVLAVLQLDMTDYMGSAEDIALMDDFTNSDLNAFLGTLIDTYQPTLLWTYSTCGYGCSDHVSWHNEGYAASFPFESRFGPHNPNIHTSNDDLATLGNQADHALKFAQLALSFAIETSSSCSLGAQGDACSSGTDCCSGNCKGNGVCR